MASTNKIRRSSMLPQGLPGSMGIGVKSQDGRIWVDRNGEAEPIATDKVEIISANKTLRDREDGKTIVATGAASLTVTLPPTAAGLKFSLVIGSLPTSGVGHQFQPNAADKIMGNGFTASDNNKLRCAVAGDRIGDVVTIIGDGLDGWYIVDVVGTWTNPS